MTACYRVNLYRRWIDNSIPPRSHEICHNEAMLKKNILITGLPGVGKTTLVKKLAEALKNFRPAGFYTEEIREKGIRKGFALISFDGGKGILSHTDIRSPYRVGKYNVDVNGFEDFLDRIPFFSPSNSLIVIDEVGKMECLSDSFRILVKKLIESEKTVIATIALEGGGFIAEIKQRDDIVPFEINPKNRDLQLLEILQTVLPKNAHSPMPN